MSLYYQDDHVTLYHGDCLTEHREWLNADVLVTDPPYGIAYKSGGMSNSAHTARASIANDETVTARDSALASWGRRPAVVFGSWRQPRPAMTQHRLIWHKGKALPGMRTSAWYSADEEIYVLGTGFAGKPVQNVFRTENRQDGANGLVCETGHPTPKPLALMAWLVEKCPPGIIADPFAGSGATLLAARNLGRKAIGVELEERYCEVIAKRLDQGVLDIGALA